MKLKKLLIIGTVPAPIGGVTVHVYRLLEQMRMSKIDFKFMDIKRNKLREIVSAFSTHRNIHLHTSNSSFLFLAAFFCFIFRKRLLFTFHGNVGRFGTFRNLLDRLSIWLAAMPLVINKKSYQLAQSINSNTQLISAFIPPLKIEPLESKFSELVSDLRESVDTLYCTSAYNVAYDKDGNEIYQLTAIVALFKDLPRAGLILSDPSGCYLELFEKMNIEIANNVLIIPKVHDFNAVIQLSDCMIRFTTTDGDSLSVKETLLLGKSVIATNVVDRPKQVILIGNTISELEIAIRSFQEPEPIVFNENGFDDLLKIYKNYKMIDV